jgi:hypothetical protein
MVVGEVGALLTKVRLPVALLAAVGAKLTVNGLDCPGTRVSGRVSPLKAKPLPETVACDTLRLALPGLLSVTVCVFLIPNATLPKLTVDGTTEICCEEAVTPLALRAIVIGELEALLTRVRLPVALLAVVGANVTANVADLPDATVSGRESPLIVNPLPETVA